MVECGGSLTPTDCKLLSIVFWSIAFFSLSLFALGRVLGEGICSMYAIGQANPCVPLLLRPQRRVLTRLYHLF
jgi:hypothetical protein